MKNAIVGIALGLVLVTLPISEAQAGVRAGHTENGAAMARGRQGQAGGQGCVRGATANGGGSACAGTVTGPNGNSASGARTRGYRAGVGAASGSTRSAQTARGNFNSNRSNVYNAQTGAGTRNSSRSADVNRDGTSDYSANSTTSYQRGQGATTTVNTQNNGTVTCSTGSTSGRCTNTSP